MLDDFSVLLEPGFDAAAAAALAARGHAVRSADSYNAFGGAQLVVRTPYGYVAGSDHRMEGLAAGY